MKRHIVCLGDSNTHGYCADPAQYQLNHFHLLFRLLHPFCITACSISHVLNCFLDLLYIFHAVYFYIDLIIIDLFIGFSRFVRRLSGNGFSLENLLQHCL